MSCMKASATTSKPATANPHHQLPTVNNATTTAHAELPSGTSTSNFSATADSSEPRGNTRQGVDCTCTPQPVQTCITHVTHALTPTNTPKQLSNCKYQAKTTNTHHRHRPRPQPPTAPTTLVRKKNRHKLLLAGHDKTQQRHPPTLPANVHRQDNRPPQHFQVQMPHN